jgi:unsaturated chondroitin disaccharide hydrolase
MDTSAAAVAALAFLKLSEVFPDSERGRRYLCAASNTLRVLASPDYLAQPAPGGGPVLMHATANRPGRVGLDVGLVFGDYYLLEAVAICKRLPGCAGALERKGASAAGGSGSGAAKTGAASR